MTREEVFARLVESRQAFHQAIQGLSEEDMTQVQVEGVWTIKDVLGHITSWEEVCSEPLRHYADGGPFDAKDLSNTLAWNDEQAARKRDVPLNVILDELATIRQELVAAASRLSADQWAQTVPCPWGGEGPVPEILDGLSQHEWMHVRTIQRWRSG